MYGLDINFLKDRAEPIATPVQAKKAALPASAMIPLFAGLAAGLIIPGLVGGFWLWVNWRTAQTQEELNTKSAQLTTLQQETATVQELQQQIDLSRSQTQALVNVFTEIRSWSALLQEVRDLIPEGVVINSLTQQEGEPPAATAEAPPPEGEAAAVAPPPQKLVIQGFAQSYIDVNDFVLTLKNSEFFVPEETFASSVALAAYPGAALPAQIELPQVVNYTVEARLAEIPDDRLLSILERKGAFGLAERLRTARNFQQEGGTTQ